MYSHVFFPLEFIVTRCTVEGCGAVVGGWSLLNFNDGFQPLLGNWSIPEILFIAITMHLQLITTYSNCENIFRKLSVREKFSVYVEYFKLIIILSQINNNPPGSIHLDGYVSSELGNLF